MNLSKYEAMPNLVNVNCGFYSELEDMNNALQDYISEEQWMIEKEELKTYQAEQEYKHDLRMAKASGSVVRYFGE